MTDWIEHNGGPQPVGDDVWVHVQYNETENWRSATISSANNFVWASVTRYHILNQHMTAAARLEGIRLGLEAANKARNKARLRAIRRALIALGVGLP